MKKYTYTFDQLRCNPAGVKIRFESYELTMRHGGVDPDNYFTAASGTIMGESPLDACEALFYAYNNEACMASLSYKGRSMTVSDIVNLWDNEQDPPEKSSWYCDSFGFVRLQ